MFHLIFAIIILIHFFSILKVEFKLNNGNFQIINQLTTPAIPFKITF